MEYGKSSVQGNCGEKGIYGQPTKEEGADVGIVSVVSLQEEEGQKQGGGEEDPGQQGGEEPEQFLETEKEPGAIDVKNSKPFRFKGGGWQQAEKEDDGCQ